MANGFSGTAKPNSQQLQFALLKYEKEKNGSRDYRRGKLDIAAEILLFCQQMRSKTSIMYNANLNYAQMKGHLDGLLVHCLLEKKRNKFVTTKKGLLFLEVLAQLNDLLDESDSTK